MTENVPQHGVHEHGVHEHGVHEHGAHEHGAHGHGAVANAGPRTAGEWWDELYGAREQVWSGAANAALVRLAADLRPGAALDLGCGEGADAVWLALRGWRVTAVDISAVALARAAAHAAQAGVAERIEWQRHDLAVSFPAGSFELVSAHFLHAPAELGMPRERVLRAAAAAVAPGGTLLIVGHADHPPWSQHHHEPADQLATPQEVLDGLDLATPQWRVRRVESVPRQATGPDGQRATLTDAVVMAERTG
jgi:SAM-dependent methyltransferase